MAFIFVCGSQDFSSRLKGYEHLQLPCANCHNHSVVAVKRRQWFTFCYIPVIPIANHEELECTICHAMSRVTPQQLDQIARQQGQPQQLQTMQPPQNQGEMYNTPQAHEMSSPQEYHGQPGQGPPPQGYYGK